MPLEARVHESGGAVREEAEATQRRLALEASRDVVWQSHKLVGAAQHKLARVKNEGLIAANLDHLGEVSLLLARVDEGVLVVVKQAEETV